MAAEPGLEVDAIPKVALEVAPVAMDDADELIRSVKVVGNMPLASPVA